MYCIVTNFLENRYRLRHVCILNEDHLVGMVVTRDMSLFVPLMTQQKIQKSIC